MGARGSVIRNDMGAAELRWFAQGEADRRAALRALAIAQALEGVGRMQPGLSGGSASRCAMRCCATTPRVWQGCTTGLAWPDGVAGAGQHHPAVVVAVFAGA